MRLRSPKFLVLSCAAVAVVIGVFAFSRQSGDPLTLKLVRVEAVPDSRSVAVGQNKRITVRFSNCGSNSLSFIKEKKVQFWVAHRWQEPAMVLDLEPWSLSLGKKDDDVVFMAPPGAEACRFLLEYRVGSPPLCQVHGFFNRHSLYQRFPMFCRLVMKHFPRWLGVRHVERELTIPLEMQERSDRALDRARLARNSPWTCT